MTQYPRDHEYAGLSRSECEDAPPFHFDAARRFHLARWKLSSTHRFILCMRADGQPLDEATDLSKLVRVHFNIPTQQNDRGAGMGNALGLLLRAGYKPGMSASETRAVLELFMRPKAEAYTGTQTPVCPHCGYTAEDLEDRHIHGFIGRGLRDVIRDDISSSGRSVAQCYSCTNEFAITEADGGRYTTTRDIP